MLPSVPSVPSMESVGRGPLPLSVVASELGTVGVVVGMVVASVVGAVVAMVVGTVVFSEGMVSMGFLFRPPQPVISSTVRTNKVTIKLIFFMFFPPKCSWFKASISGNRFITLPKLSNCHLLIGQRLSIFSVAISNFTMYNEVDK